jgi:RND family efflux transporter MFP subunit
MTPGTFRPFFLRYRLIALILAGLVCGCTKAPPAEEVAPPAPVKWMEARQMFVEEWTEVIGTTQPLPDRSARVSAGVESQVLAILPGGSGQAVVEGQRVKKDDVLVRLDDRIARANRDKMEADVDEVQQQVQQAAFGVRLAQIEYDRLQDLSKAGAAGGRPLASPVEMEKAQVTLEEMKSKQTGADLHLKAGQKQLLALDEQLKLYSLTAPIAGRLSRIFVVPGQTLPVGTIAAEIVDIDDQIDLLCFVPPYIAHKLKEGQAVRLGPAGDQGTAAPGKGANAEGKIVYIGDQSEIDTGNFPIKARFANKTAGLRGNVTRRARVRTAPGKACLTLPESALMEDQDPPAVFVVEDVKEVKDKDGKDMETGKARKLRVTVGVRDRVLHLVEVLGVDDPEKKWQGSLETAKFVYERGQGLRTGDPVRLEVEDEDEEAGDQKKDEKP